jgi:hypothetical protein
MPRSIWTIRPGGVTGGNFGMDLLGCHITENAGGTAYEFTEPNINNVLATTPGSTLPTGGFHFPEFTYNGPTWSIQVNSLTTNQAQGTWEAIAGQIEGTRAAIGDWIAQAGSGAGGDEPETATSATA